MGENAAIVIRPYRAEDLDAVIEIFLRAIREVAIRDYSQAEVDAWAQADRASWSERRLSRPAWVAWIGPHPVGFSDLVPNGYLDMMFVHPHWQRRGVAAALLRTVESAARADSLGRIFTDASLTARPFFAHFGFRVVAAQEVEIRGQTLRNFRMEKLLA
jgi:putative acetyltransferase